MKWFLTGDTLGIAAALRAGGEDVVSVPAFHRDNVPDIEEPGDYRLDKLLRRPEAEGVEVLVLDRLLAAPGYAKRYVFPWAGADRNRCVVGIGPGDPEEYNEWAKSHRQCIVGAPHIAVYVSPDLGVIEKLRAARRAVLYQGDVNVIVRAVRDALEYKQVDNRIYTRAS